ncbi:MAG: quaternary ammonium compound efflux SMR transporter SugE [Hyphomonadaceae bacterium]|nr:quaternary ammonium compound efflux SMR transporter SugE [Hyphomonadaceae bacterium]
MNAWIMLAIAGALEVVWAIGLKYAEGFTRPAPSAITVAAMIASMWLLAQAARTLPIGTAYAVWTGIGAVGAALLGMMLFAESANVVRLGCIGLIVAGIIGLKLTSPA